MLYEVGTPSTRQLAVLSAHSGLRSPSKFFFFFNLSLPYFPISLTPIINNTHFCNSNVASHETKLKNTCDSSLRGVTLYMACSNCAWQPFPSMAEQKPALSNLPGPQKLSFTSGLPVETTSAEPGPAASMVLPAAEDGTE